jgi:hypothetical protein
MSLALFNCNRCKLASNNKEHNEQFHKCKVLLLLIVTNSLCPFIIVFNALIISCSLERPFCIVSLNWYVPFFQERKT